MIERYNHQGMAAVWSEQSKYQNWANIELAHCKALTGVSRRIIITPRNITAIKRIETRKKHDVAAFVEWLERKVGSRFIHFGLTSSDIVDTGFTMQLRAANNIITTLANKLINVINATPTNNINILGRTHGQAAEPILLRDKLTRYANLIKYSIPNLPYYGRMAGSVGVYRYLDESYAIKILNILNLQSGYLDGQVISRAYYAQFMSAWTIMASILEKIATDYRLLAQTEIGEVVEAQTPGQVGSSSMPHKINPVGLENICGIARVIRGYNTTALENIALWHERDISHSSAERIVFPDASILLAYSLEKLAAILSKITYNTDKIANNLKLVENQVGSQRKMLSAIVNGQSRAAAHKKFNKR